MRERERLRVRRVVWVRFGVGGEVRGWGEGEGEGGDKGGGGVRARVRVEGGGKVDGAVRLKGESPMRLAVVRLAMRLNAM